MIAIIEIKIKAHSCRPLPEGKPDGTTNIFSIKKSVIPHWYEIVVTGGTMDELEKELEMLADRYEEVLA